MIPIILITLCIVVFVFSRLNDWTADNRYGYEIFSFGKALINIAGIASMLIGIAGLPTSEGFAPLLFGCSVLGIQWFVTCSRTSFIFGTSAFFGLTLLSVVAIASLAAVAFLTLAAHSNHDR